MSWQSQLVVALEASLVRPLVLAAAAWLTLRILRVQHPASRHAVWTGVLLAMLVSPLASWTLPHWRLTVLPASRETIAVPTGGEAVGASRSGGERDAGAVAATPAMEAQRAWPGVETLIAACYLAGLIAMAVYRAAGWVLLWRLLSRSAPVKGRWLRESADVLTPVAVGLLRPSVVLPAGWRGWSRKTRAAVLAHEGAHLRRRDAWVSSLAHLVEAVYWFHPLAWWVGRKVEELAELSCDAAAVARTQDPAGYSRILLAFAETVNGAGGRVAMPGLAMASARGMDERIEQAFELSRGTVRKLGRVGALAGLLVLPLFSLAPAVEFVEAPQERGPAVAFEVASIKIGVIPPPTPMFCLVPCTPGQSIKVEGLRVNIRYTSLKELILAAYGIKAHQLSGPDWMRSQRFEIMANIPAGVSRDRLPEMLQSLLAERFKLAIHRETKEQSVYALVTGKDGPKLTESGREADAPAPDMPGAETLYSSMGDARDDGNGNLQVTSGPYGPIRSGRGPDNAVRMDLLKVSMQGLAEIVAPHLDRPVIDMTNLKGTYHVSWEWPPLGGGRRAAGEPNEIDPFAETLLKTVEKLGLKLERRKAPVAMIVVDHLEKSPTAN